MKSTTLIACCLGFALALTSPLVVMAQNAKPPVKKVVPKKPTAKKPTVKKAASSAFVPQSDEVKGLATLFKGGKFNCEFNNTLTIVANDAHPGYFTLTHKGKAASMLVIPTNTGALRLENKASGFVWLQLPTKSMLMNSKIGQRLADDCHLAS